MTTLQIAKRAGEKGVGPTTHYNLNEQHLVDLGMKRHLVMGTGWVTTSSMKDAVFYYEKGRVSIKCSEISWYWFIDDKPRNDLAVSNKVDLKKLLKKYSKK